MFVSKNYKKQAVQCIFSWLLFGMGLWFAYDLSYIEAMLTPELPRDATKILQLFNNTSIAAMKRQVRKEIVAQASSLDLGGEARSSLGSRSTGGRS